MRFLSGILLVGTAVAAVVTPGRDTLASSPPAPSEIKILDVTAIGSGCPAGHAVVNVDSTRTIFDVAFDQYIVAAGPGSSVSDSRKNCRISINLQFPSGYQ
jgi:hypothetical protein